MPRSPPCSVGCPRFPPASPPPPWGGQTSRTPCRSLPTFTAVWPAQWRGDGERRCKGSTSLAIRGRRGAEVVREDVLEEDLARPQLPDLVRGLEPPRIRRLGLTLGAALRRKAGRGARSGSWWAARTARSPASARDRGDIPYCLHRHRGHAGATGTAARDRGDRGTVL